MGVVAADVLDARDRRLVGRIPDDHRSHGIHVRTVGHHRPRLAAAQNRDHPVAADAGFDVEAEGSQLLRDESGRLFLFTGQFRVLVQMPPDFDQLRFDLRGLVGDTPEQRGIGFGGDSRTRSEHHQTQQNSRPRKASFQIHLADLLRSFRRSAAWRRTYEAAAEAVPLA